MLSDYDICFWKCEYSVELTFLRIRSIAVQNRVSMFFTKLHLDIYNVMKYQSTKLVLVLRRTQIYSLFSYSIKNKSYHIYKPNHILVTSALLNRFYARITLSAFVSNSILLIDVQHKVNSIAYSLCVVVSCCK